MKYRVQLAPSVAVTFKRFNPEIRKQLKVGLKELAGNPYAGKGLQDDLTEFRSYRIKRYRIIYTVEDGERLLKIYMIGHRREIYDLFSKFIRGEG